MSGQLATAATGVPGAPTRPLSQARVALVGLGALGHTIGLDLARAGVGHLRLLDGDIVTADTTSRQYPLGYAGFGKTRSLAHLIRTYNPWTEVKTVPHRLGVPGRNPDLDLLGDPPRPLDLVIDATAEPDVTRFLAHWSAARAVPFISVTATAGGRGGTLLRLPSAAGGCYRCLEHHRRTRTLPVPPELSGAWVRPPRCSATTYTGYGHDLALLAHQASRLAVDTLIHTPDERAQAAYWVADVPVDGSPAQWVGQPLSVHPACPLPHAEPAERQLTLWTGDVAAAC